VENAEMPPKGAKSMSKLEVAKVEESDKQVTIDFESGTIVDGFLENGTHLVWLQGGPRHSITVKDGALVEVA
jgi:hypothetical protein